MVVIKLKVFNFSSALMNSMRASVWHLVTLKCNRYLRRFLQKTTDFAANSHFKPASNMDVPLGQMITDSKVNMSAVIGATSTNTIQGLEFQNLIKKKIVNQ